MHISPEFIYAGFVSERKDVTSVGGNRELFMKTDSYLFVKSFHIKKDSGKYRKYYANWK